MEVRPGYRKTDVGVIPNDWEVRPLGRLCRLINGRGFKPFEWRKNGLPIIRIQNLNGSDEFNYYDGAYDKKLEVAKGQLLFAWSGSRGTSFGPHIWNGPFGLLNYHTWKVESRESEVLDRFLYQKLKQLTAAIEGSAHGASALVHVQKWQMEALEIALPSDKAEQSAIADAMSDADAHVEALEQLLAKKRQVKQGAMQELLTGKRRLPGFSGEWQIKRLGQLATIVRGASPRPIESPIWFDENSSVGWVRISDVTRSGRFLTETAQRLSALGIQFSRPVSCGSLIMSICATVGRPIITQIRTCIHDGFVVFENPTAKVGFLYYLLQSLEGTWSQRGQTGSQMNLNTELIKRTEVAIPPTADEQAEIASALSDMDRAVDALEEKLAKARQIKQGMMQELLTGRIRLV